MNNWTSPQPQLKTTRLTWVSKFPRPITACKTKSRYLWCLVQIITSLRQWICNRETHTINSSTLTIVLLIINRELTLSFFILTLEVVRGRVNILAQLRVRWHLRIQRARSSESQPCQLFLRAVKSQHCLTSLSIILRIVLNRIQASWTKTLIIKCQILVFSLI